MSNKIMSSGELLSNLNKNIDKGHHKNINSHSNSEKIAQEEVNTKIKHLQLNNDSDKEEEVQHKQIQKVKQKQKVRQSREKIRVSQKEQIEQTSKTQNKTIRSNLSRASEIKIKKNNIFKENFLNSSHSIQEQELGETLHQILAMQIGKLISEPLAEVIEATMKQKQNTIYIFYTQPNKDYLQNLVLNQKKKQNNCISEIQNLLNKRENNTLRKIDEGELYIDYQRSITSKAQAQQLHKLDIARLLKIKQGAIRSKLDLLNDKIFQFQALQSSPKNNSPSQSLKQYQHEKLQEISDPTNFSLNSQRTKIANDYVKHLQQQKILLLKKMRQRQQKRSQLQKQRQIQLKQAQQMRNAAKKEQIQQRIGQTKKKKELQTVQHTQKSKKVQQFLKEYRKSLPLYRKKQKQFIQVYQKKRQKDIQQKLNEIRQNRRSMSLNEIQQHEQKYLQRKSLEQSKKQEQFKMIIKAKKIAQSGPQYFKGFYHDKVKILDQQERLKFYSLRQSTKLKVQRMTQFDKQIRKNHKPKIDQKKKQDLERVIQIAELKKKKVKKMFRQIQSQNGQTKIEAYYEQMPEKNLYKEGNKFMQVAKSLAKKTKPEQNSRYQEQPVIVLQQLQESQIAKKQDSDWKQTSSPIISQQKDIWRLRSKQMHQMTGEISPQNFNQVKKNLELMDDKAKLREELLKHKDSDAHEMMEEKSMLDQFYLESIKNKIKLLND